MVCSTFINFFSFNLRNYMFQSAEKCEMTSFYMTSLHVGLNEAAKCVAIIPFTLLASLSRPPHTHAKYKMATIFGLTYENNQPIYESWRYKNLERTHDWCLAVGKVAF